MMEEGQNNSSSQPSRALGVALLILFVVCLLILLWVIMIAARFLLGLGG